MGPGDHYAGGADRPNTRLVEQRGRGRGDEVGDLAGEAACFGGEASDAQRRRAESERAGARTSASSASSSTKLEPKSRDRTEVGPNQTSTPGPNQMSTLSSEAAFAMLADASPIPASSGRTIRHRLNRGGDRQLNRALHTISDERRHALAGWLWHYNHRRPHKALGHQAPVTRTNLHGSYTHRSIAPAGEPMPSC